MCLVSQRGVTAARPSGEPQVLPVRAARSLRWFLSAAERTSSVLPSSQTVSTEKNNLYYGDNYEVLKLYVKDETVDLVYLDPPFNSRQDYNVLFAEKAAPNPAPKFAPSKTPGNGTTSPCAPTSRSSSRGAASPTPCAPSGPSSTAPT